MSANTEEFQDYYEILQVSPSAELDTIHRVFRLLAQRYHPDNKETGNEAIFHQMLKAYQVLHDPAQRAAYDTRHRQEKQVSWQVFDQSAEPEGRVSERKKREGILGVLYRKRQHTPQHAAMSVRELEGLLGIPKEHLEFPLWYLKEVGAVKGGDNARYAITALGVNQYEEFKEPSESGSSANGKKIFMLPAATDSKAN